MIVINKDAESTHCLNAVYAINIDISPFLRSLRSISHTCLCAQIPKSQKDKSSHQYLLGSALAKAAHKTWVKLTPGENQCPTGNDFFE